jgi:hypothetical protein
MLTNALQLPVAAASSATYRNLGFLAWHQHQWWMRGTRSSSLWPLPLALPNETLGFSASTSAADAGSCWCRRRGCRCPRILLLNANNGDEVIQLSPTLLFCYVRLVLMVICFVILPNELVNDIL